MFIDISRCLFAYSLDAVYSFIPTDKVQQELSLSGADVHTANEAHYPPRRSPTRSIEIVVIAMEFHPDERYVVQFNMAVAEQQVHIYKMAVERVASTGTQQ